MKKVLTYVFAIAIGVILASNIKTTAADIPSSQVSYTNNNQSTVNSALNDLFSKVGKCPDGNICYEVPKVSGLTPDNLGNFRYSGQTVNNYVSFNGESWRIIGIFSNIENGNKVAQFRLKIIKSDTIGTYAWDSSNNNSWSDSSLKTYLNGDYLENNISNDAKLLIDNAVWKLGKGGNELTSYEAYTAERGTTLSWTGKIALMDFSDYGYAADSSCYSKTVNYYDECEKNWLKYGNEWVLFSMSSNYVQAGMISRFGIANFANAKNKIEVRPVIYLKSGVYIKGGEGTTDKPYVLAI